MWEYLRSLPELDRQRAVLEVFVRMHLTVTSMQKYTHVRYSQLSDGETSWTLLDADDDGLREEKQVHFGEAANFAANAVLGGMIKEQPYEIARLTIKFHPPTLAVDILNDTNTPILSGVLIDLDMEQQVQRELLAHMKEE